MAQGDFNAAVYRKSSSGAASVISRRKKSHSEEWLFNIAFLNQIGIKPM
jgi:hypothetical protein